MRLGRSRRSENVEDRRGMGGLSRGIAVGGAGGVGLIVLLLVAMALGVDPTVLLQPGPDAPPGAAPGTGTPGSNAPDDVQDFVAAVLGETEDMWTQVFREQGRTYQPPKLVLFSGVVNSACGTASSAVGPFYCPLDQRVYLDYGFFRDLETRLGASGDFAEAYVIAHEVGHHVQTLLGITRRVTQMRESAGETESNALSVRFELQADCLAGIWANRAQRARQILEPGDVEEGIAAAEAVGDDRIQQRTRGTIVPDSFTHGTSAQRVSWFRRGLESGDPGACNTLSGQ